MLLNKLREYVVEPLYTHPEVPVLNQYIVLNHSLVECEKRVIDILSYGEAMRLHQFIDRFPWHQLEELMGEHLQTAIRLTQQKTRIAQDMKEPYIPNIFDKYMFHHRIDAMA